MGDSQHHVRRASGPWLLAEITWTALRIRRLVARNDLPVVVARCRREHRQPVAAPSHDDVVRVGRAVRKVLGVLPGDSSPLVTSLVLIAVLARRGVDTSLMIGMRDGAEPAPQAWVELGGLPASALRDKFAHLVSL